MRVAIISDVHANAEALTATLDDVSGINADKFVVLGDVVGYGADAEACTWVVMTLAGDEPDVDVVPGRLLEAAVPYRDRLICAVMGNHDMAIFNDEVLGEMRREAVEAVVWQRKRLAAEAVEFFRVRPFEVSYGDAVFVHGSPYDPERFDYILSGCEAADVLSRVAGRLFFIGHTHDPVVFSDGGATVPTPGAAVKLAPENRYIINVGSVGQPRDRNPKACYVIWDTDAATVEFRRVEYDIEAAAAKIYVAGLPRMLGDRLFVGM